VGLQRAITENRHLGYRRILRERPEYQTMIPAPVLMIWREFVENGRANTTATHELERGLTETVFEILGPKPPPVGTQEHIALLDDDARHRLGRVLRARD
jgi:hypothetical protein